MWHTSGSWLQLDRKSGDFIRRFLLPLGLPAHMMYESSDRIAGYKLIETGALVAFDVLDSHVEGSPFGGFVRMQLQLGEIEDDGERTEDHEWGAFGLIFCIAVMSFHDARPRGVSGMDFEERDEFTVADLHDHLRYERSELRFSADYVRGRCVKTDVTVRPDGSVTIATRNRGESALRWVQLLKGRKHISALPPAS
jgi:hypothetical protein